MAIRGASSKSFLRERDDFTVAVGDFVEGYEFETSYDIDTMLHLKDSHGKYIYNKKQIFDITENLGYNKHIVINAKNLLGMNSEKIRSIVDEFKLHIEDFGISGILEFHANDKTQKSFHFHFWTNNDSQYIRDVLRDFVLENQLADEDNVDIQGKYADFKELKKEALAQGLDYKEVEKYIKDNKRGAVERADTIIEQETLDVFKPRPDRANSLIARIKEQMAALSEDSLRVNLINQIIENSDESEIEEDVRESRRETIRYKDEEEINSYKERNRALYKSAHRELTKGEPTANTDNMRALSIRDLAHLRERPKMLLQDDTHPKLRIERFKSPDTQMRWADDGDSGSPRRARGLIARIKEQAEATKTYINSLYGKQKTADIAVDMTPENIDSIYEKIAKRSEEAHKMNQAVLKSKGKNR